MGKPKYTKEQRKQAYDLYWEGERVPKFGGTIGKYTLREIGKQVGMTRHSVCRIARGQR